MITDALTRQTRSLSEYAEELRADRLQRIEDINGWPSIVPPNDLLGRYDRVCARLLAVEREINARACI